jgi:MFS family permease
VLNPERRNGDRAAVSWAPASATSEPERGLRGRWQNRRVSIFDILMVGIGVIVFDFIGALIASGWQSARCGDSCGLQTQLHLLRIGVWILLVIAVAPLVVMLMLRRHRIMVAVLQVGLCAVLLGNNLADQHQKSSRLNGTAQCWSTLYSNADCPWGNRN